MMMTKQDIQNKISELQDAQNVVLGKKIEAMIEERDNNMTIHSIKYNQCELKNYYISGKIDALKMVLEGTI